MKRNFLIVLFLALVCLGYAFYQYQNIYDPKDPKLFDAQKNALMQKVTDLKSSLDNLDSIYENGEKYNSLNRAYQSLKDRYKSKHPKMQELLSQLELLASDHQKLDVVAKERESKKAEYSILLKEYENFLTSAQPSLRQTSIYFIIALLLLSLGMGALYILDRRIYHPKHILKVQKQLPLLVVMPKLSKREHAFPLHLHHYPTSLYSKSVVLMRNRLLTMPTQLKVIGVASLGQKKSPVSLASNLAISLVQASKKVLLIDCQFQEPKQHRYFKLPNQGLAQLLRGDPIAPLNVEVPGLKVLPAGEGLGIKFLISDQFSKALNTFKEQYDFIFIDVPSFSLESESILIAGKTDGVILTVSRGQVTQEAFRGVKTELDRNHIKLCGVVLKDVPVLKTHRWNHELVY